MKAPTTADEGSQPRAASQLPWHGWAVPQTYRASAPVRTSVYEGTAHSAFGNWGCVVINSCNPDLDFSLQSEWLRGTELPAGFKP